MDSKLPRDKRRSANINSKYLTSKLDHIKELTIVVQKLKPRY